MKHAARVAILLGASAAVCWGLVVSYRVEPRTAAMSGWTSQQAPNNRVSQQVICNWDELDSASGGYVQLFAGNHGAGGLYNLDIYEGGNGPLVAYRHDLVPGLDHTWLTFDKVKMEPGESFVKGRQYEFRFTRGGSGSDSIQFYTDPTGPYEYGDIILPGGNYQPPPTGTDLCMRVLAALNPVDSSYWGFNVGWPDTACTTAVRRRADSAGVSADRFWFGADWMARGRDTYQFPHTEFGWSHGQLGCEEVSVLVACPWWASTRVLGITWVEDRPETLWSGLCPPRGLYAAVDSDTNYWARFVKCVVDTAGDRIHTWEAYNEANVIDRFWQRPNTGYYPDTSDSGMCALYTRLCVVTDSVVRLDSSHANDIVLVGSMSEVENAGTDPYRVRGKDWLRMMYHFSGGFRWDGVTVHPYQPAGQAFDPALFLCNADTIRAVMREHGDYGPLWITELGWNTRQYGGQHNFVSEEQQAVNFCQTYTAALASEASPSAGYDRVYWFSFVDIGGENAEHFSLLDTMPDCLPKYAVWASGQTRGMLAGKRYNGRVLSGDAGLDTQAYAYEFEDPADGRRTWVAWKSDGREAEVALPCRVDSLATTELAYGPSTEVRAAAAGADGWFRTRVGARPVFVSEPATARISRADVIVDSIRVTTPAPRVGERLDATVYLRDVGNRPTPEGTPVVVALSIDGTELGRSTVRNRITGASTTTVSVRLPASAAGSRLLSAVANPDARFVELDADNNAAYAPVTILPRTR